MTKLNELEPGETDKVETPDVVLVAQISNPLNTTIRKLTWSEEFVVLGQNFLTELKDRISCFRNEIKVGEYSENPDKLEEGQELKDIVKSGYFFIENTVYNDLRFGNADCSEPIKKWTQERNVGNIESKAMETTRFVDLTIRLGFPYLYNHLGNCEHLIIFTSAKLINPSTDCYLKSAYPIVKEKARGRYTFCWCCNKIYAKRFLTRWIVTNSKFAVDDPTFMCERCLRNTHYLDDEETDGETAQNGPIYKKIIDFKAYHYSQL